MKITLRYEEADEKELHMTLRLTLPKKYQTGPSKDVVKLFADHYNKKHAEHPLDAAVLHLKVVGGNHLELGAKMEDFVASGDECYLLGGEVLTGSEAPAKRVPASSPAPPPPAPVAAAAAAGGAKAEKGKLRCKRFGCNKHFDPDAEPQEECVHHKAAPVFHETAKWWSCCTEKKAYDWEQFMKIPGCQKGTHSENADDQGKRYLGGSDLRGDCAPVRLDADAPRDPRHKLGDMRRGLIAIGVDGDLFDKVWGKLAAESGGDIDKVVTTFATRFGALLDNP